MCFRSNASKDFYSVCEKEPKTRTLCPECANKSLHHSQLGCQSSGLVALFVRDNRLFIATGRSPQLNINSNWGRFIPPVADEILN